MPLSQFHLPSLHLIVHFMLSWNTFLHKERAGKFLVTLLALVSRYHVFLSHWKELCKDKGQNSAVLVEGIGPPWAPTQAMLTSEMPLETLGSQQSAY